jgi:uncharacterized protein (TIGR04222 family)
MSYNPFDLRGPEFLVFFSLFALVLSILLHSLRTRNEATETQTFDLAQDPYQIAYLRGGRNHLIQTAVFSLVDRGFLLVRGSHLRTTGHDAASKVRKPLEKAILKTFLKEGEVSSLFSDPHVIEQAESFGDQLKIRRLLPDEGQVSYRRKLFLTGMVLLWTVAGTKIYVALSRGHRNILFLILLGAVFTIVLRRVVSPHRTYAGHKEYQNLKSMYSGLYEGRQSLHLHGATNDLILLAALFGMTALPAAAAAMVQPLKMRAVGDSIGSSGCGSGSSDGGSCGGGCGGGCGGCG